MPLLLEDFIARARTALIQHPGREGRERVLAMVREALADADFVHRYIDANDAERKILYEDPELGFTILVHTYHGPRNTPPHDHGPTWAIYGQARGETVMTDWQCLARPTASTPGKAKRLRDYVLRPGDAYLYEPGELHSPRRDGPTRLLRIEGLNLDRVRRLPYEAVEAAA